MTAEMNNSEFVESSADSSKYEKKSSVGYHILRISLFLTAAVCAVIGMFLLNQNTNHQVEVETVANGVIRSESQARVLLIMSYDDSHATVPYERKGVLDYMKRSGVEVDVEYMDTKAYPVGSPAYDAWKRTMAEKIASSDSYNAIICADDDALTFVEQNHDTLFRGLPVVFFGVNDFDHATRATQSGYETGIYENSSLADTMRAASVLLPGANKFLAIVDNTSTGRGSCSTFESLKSEFSGFEFNIVNTSELTHDELGERLSNVGDDTIVIHLASYEDADGNAYSLDESSHYVAEKCSRPVFRDSIGGVGEGICGSGFVDYEKQGAQAAEMCIQILNGELPGNLPLVTDATPSYIYDAKVLDRFGLDKSDVPVDAIMINEHGISWQSVRPILFPVFLLLLAVTFILAFAYIGYARSLRDSLEILESRNNLRYRLFHDILTDLPNRQALMQFLHDEKNGSIQSIVSIDLNDFGDINDSYGHDCGDYVLKEISRRLSEIDSKLLVRSAGDEFILVLGERVEPESALLAQIMNVFDEKVAFGDSVLDIEASYGVANWDESMDESSIVQCVDLAIRNAKVVGGGDSVFFYDEQMKRDMERKLEITDYLKLAIAEESPVVLFQPQVNTYDKSVYGYEALVRLKDNAYFPDQFIPVAEAAGLVSSIDRIVTKKVIQQQAAWRAEGREMKVVSINYSAAQLRDETYCDFVESLLREYDVEPRYLKIEITESMMLENEGLAEELFSRLEQMGISLALDDFGTGYSSLYRMATTPAEYVKLDKSLVDTYMVPGKEDFIDHLTQLIHGIDKKIIVEGVETAEQYAICKRMGCDIIQGYFFARPLPSAEAGAFDPKTVA